MERDKTVFIKCPSTDSEYRKNLVLFDFQKAGSLPPTNQTLKNSPFNFGLDICLVFRIRA